MLQFQRYFRYFDWLTFITTLLLSISGIFAIFSATYRPELPYSIFFKKQLIGLGCGFGLYIFCALTDYRTFCRIGFYVYFAVIILLLFTVIKGSIGMGAQRWINLFFFKAQPSELAKLFFPAFFAYFFSDQKADTFKWNTFGIFLAALGTSFFLIAKQPDLGTALTVLFCGLSLFWLAGAPRKFFITLFVASLIGIPMGWQLLKPYQKNRIAVFLGQHQHDKEGYQIEQSKIAIGSGGLFGKGFLNGTQNKLRFLPEGRTDFIFAVICEEWGLVGATIIILLFVIIFSRLFWIVFTLKYNEGYLLMTGLIIPLIIATIINLGMVVGLLPVVGVPLPFISYGLSHLWISLASLGILQSITIRRFYH